MRALVLKDWWTLELVELPEPELGSGEVLLDILATGICGSDLHGFTGETGRRKPGQVMGHETVGRIAALGGSVDARLELEVGGLATVNPVVTCGECEACRGGYEQACPTRSIIGVDPAVRSAFAERMAVPAVNVVPLPETLSAELGALVEPLAVGYHAVRRGGVRPGDPVFVIGGGPIGQACLLAAQREGASSVVVSEPNPDRRRLVAALGARTVDPGEAPDLSGAVHGLLGGAPKVVLDAVGTSGSLAGALGAASPSSVVVLVGMGAEQVQVPAYEVSVRERSIVGSYCYSMAEFRETAEWVAAAADRLAPLVEGRTDLAGGQEAFAGLARGENPASKVLVFPNGLPG